MIIEISFMMREIGESCYSGEFTLFHRETGKKRVFTFSYSNCAIGRKVIIRLKGKPFLDVSSVKSLKGNQRNLFRLIHKPFKDMLNNLRLEKEDYSAEAIEFFQNLGIPLDFEVQDEYDIDVQGSDQSCVMQLFEATQ